MFDINETNSLHKLLLTGRRVSSLCKANIKLQKMQLSEIMQLGGFLGRSLGPMIKVGLPFMKNALTALSKSILIPLWWGAAAIATDPEIHKKSLTQEFMVLWRQH